MDWYLPNGDATVLPALRREIVEHLVRHAEAGADIDAAELVISELITNALQHTSSPVWVQLEWLEDSPSLVIRDLGPGFELSPATPQSPAPVAPEVTQTRGRGLFFAAHLASQLAVAARRGGGAEVSVVLPVSRAASPSFEVAPVRFSALPALHEASAHGAFARDAFLRALVVQLADAIERADGPAIAERCVAEVGSQVGSQMELEYRMATGVVGKMNPEQMADCFVRLKNAIDGQFYVIEASEERIVLGNHRCPFGDAVRNSPSLCRMTSSVFGGIAARNGDGEAAVILEERIAVGDPGCRIVVQLGAPPSAAVRFAHRYRAT